MGEMADTKQMREERARLIEQAREVQNRADGQGRVMTAEEREQWDRLMDDAEEIRENYERYERMEAAQADLETPQNSRRPVPSNGTRSERVDQAVRGRATDEDRNLALAAWLIVEAIFALRRAQAAKLEVPAPEPDRPTRM
jgi:hypothetical protein